VKPTAEGIEASEIAIEVGVDLDGIFGDAKAPRLRVVRIGGEHRRFDEGEAAARAAGFPIAPGFERRLIVPEEHVLAPRANADSGDGEGADAEPSFRKHGGSPISTCPARIRGGARSVKSHLRTSTRPTPSP
jgi:hypothetical protein